MISPDGPSTDTPAGKTWPKTLIAIGPTIQPRKKNPTRMPDNPLRCHRPSDCPHTRGPTSTAGGEGPNKHHVKRARRRQRTLHHPRSVKYGMKGNCGQSCLTCRRICQRRRGADALLISKPWFGQFGQDIGGPVGSLYHRQTPCLTTPCRERRPTFTILR